MCLVLMEWPYVMLVESVVFVLLVAGFINLQNTFTGVNHYTYPVLVTTGLLFVVICWALSVLGLVILTLIESSPGLQMASVLLRSSRVLCVLIASHVLIAAVLCVNSSDPDMCVAMFASNHVFSAETALMYHVFAAALALCTFFAVGCSVIAQHSTLRAIHKISPAHPVSRVSWNVSLLITFLFEIEVMVQHNSSTAFAIRPTYLSWHTIVALPFLFLMDTTCAKLQEESWRGNFVPGVAFLGIHLLAVVLCIVLVVLHPVLRHPDNVVVNVVAISLLAMCATFESLNLLLNGTGTDTPPLAEPSNPPAIPVPNKDTLFEMPVRTGVRSFPGYANGRYLQSARPQPAPPPQPQPFAWPPTYTQPGPYAPQPMQRQVYMRPNYTAHAFDWDAKKNL